MESCYLETTCLGIFKHSESPKSRVREKEKEIWKRLATKQQISGTPSWYEQ